MPRKGASAAPRALAVPTFVLDTSALLTFLYSERGWNRVQALLLRAVDGRANVRLHRIHMGEAYYVLYRKGGERAAEEMVDDAQRLPIIVEDRVSPALMREAARIKATYKLSYADAFAGGLAKVREGTLVSSDRSEFAPWRLVPSFRCCGSAEIEATIPAAGFGTRATPATRRATRGRMWSSLCSWIGTLLPPNPAR